MIMISPLAGARRRLPANLARSVQRWIAKAAKRRRISREMAALRLLSDHLLRDMGLETEVPPRDPVIPHHLR